MAGQPGWISGCCFSLTRFWLRIWNTQEYFGEEKRESVFGLVSDEDASDGSNVVGETILFDAPKKGAITSHTEEGFYDFEGPKSLRILP